jgi:hypothetical protein
MHKSQQFSFPIYQSSAQKMRRCMVCEPSAPLQTCVSKHPVCLVTRKLYFFSVAHQLNSGLRRPIVEVSKSHTIRHTPGRSPLDEWSAPRTDQYRRNTNKHTRRTSTHSAGFEPANPGIERPQIYVLDRTATGIGYWSYQPFLTFSSCKILKFWHVSLSRKTGGRTGRSKHRRSPNYTQDKWA